MSWAGSAPTGPSPWSRLGGTGRSRSVGQTAGGIRRGTCARTSTPRTRSSAPRRNRPDRGAVADRRGGDWVDDYELEVREPGKEQGDPVLTLRWQGPSQLYPASRLPAERTIPGD